MRPYYEVEITEVRGGGTRPLRVLATLHEITATICDQGEEHEKRTAVATWSWAPPQAEEGETE